jgi:hypothetical protein
MGLLDDLIPVVDSARSVAVDVVGHRPYTVAVIRRTWSGDRVGEGTPTDIEIALNPAPAIVERSSDAPTSMGRVRGVLRPAGAEEEGDVALVGVSFSIPETTLYHPSPKLAENEEHFYVIRDAHETGIRQRFYVAKAPPVPDWTKGFGWMVDLRRIENVSPVPEAED